MTVPAGEVEARSLLSAVGLILRGRGGGARKFPRVLAFSPDLDFDHQHTFVQREAGMMDLTCLVHELTVPRNFFNMRSLPGTSSKWEEFV